MKFLFVVLALFLSNDVLAFNEFRKNYDIKLSNGEVIRFNQVQVAYAGGSNEYVVIFRYFADSIDDKALLERRAKLMWPIFRPFVEEKGFRYAGIKAAVKIANKKSGPLHSNLYTEYSFGYALSDSGKWEFLAD